MAYQMTPKPVTLNDLEGHSPVARLFKCNSSTICAAFCKILHDTECRAVHLRHLRFLYDYDIISSYTGVCVIRSICTAECSYIAAYK